MGKGEVGRTQKLSLRVKQLQPSATLAITARAKELKAAGENVLSLAAGEPDFPTPEHIRHAATEAMNAGHTGYAPSAGVPRLRDRIRQLYQEQLGLSYQDSQVVVSCGAKHCLYNAFMSLLEQGTEALIQAPYWVSYPEQVRLCGAKPVIIEAPPSGFGLNLDAISSAINERTRVIILNSPCNPTGHVEDDSVLDAIADLAMGRDLTVVSDDIYDKLIYDGRRFTSINQRAPDMKDRTVLINGVSKTYSMTGWRLGWAVGPPEIIGSMRKIQDQSTSNATTFVQHAAIAALDSPDGIVEEMVEAFERRRNRIVDALTRIPGVTCAKPAGTFYVMPLFSSILNRKFEGDRIGSSFRLAEILLEKERVAVVPGEAFGAPGYLRLSFAASEEAIEEAVARIKHLVESLQ
jgi:aspartate aminotransferase